MSISKLQLKELRTASGFSQEKLAERHSFVKLGFKANNFKLGKMKGAILMFTI